VKDDKGLKRNLKMKYRNLGRTGLNVSEIGFGAWGISGAQWIGAEDDVSLKTLKTAHDNGVNFFDTALAYGAGHSEQLINRAFGKSPDVIVASKVPPKNDTWPARKGSPLRDVFPKEYVLASLDQSLKNLGRDQVDVYQFHVWSDGWADQEEWLETVRQMRDSGKARSVGISINDHQPTNVLKALDTGLVDTVQVIYNIFDQTPDDELFPYCRKHDIGVIARVPFDEGSLTGNVRPETTFPAGDFRNDYFTDWRKKEVWDRVQHIARDAAIPVENMPELALRFCISDPTVSTVIPGMRTPQRVITNVAVSDAGPLPSDLLSKMRNHRWVSW
jgi:aryl-alcohol dehydrogenase-like predicted oxidoreductase